MSIPVHNYKQKTVEGKAGVATVARWLLRHPLVVDITDHQETAEFRSKDVDLLASIVVHDGTRRHIPVEVKADSHGLTNLYFETVSNLSKGTPGCLMYTAATIVAYLYTQQDVLLLLPFPEFREWFLAHEDEFIDKRVGTSNDYGVYWSAGKVIPLKRVISEERALVVRLDHPPETYRRQLAAMLLRPPGGGAQNGSCTLRHGTVS